MDLKYIFLQTILIIQIEGKPKPEVYVIKIQIQIKLQTKLLFHSVRIGKFRTFINNAIHLKTLKSVNFRTQRKLKNFVNKQCNEKISTLIESTMRKY